MYASPLVINNDDNEEISAWSCQLKTITLSSESSSSQPNQQLKTTSYEKLVKFKPQRGFLYRNEVPVPPFFLAVPILGWAPSRAV